MRRPDDENQEPASLFSLHDLSTVVCLGLCVTLIPWLTVATAQVTTTITGSGLNTSIQHTDGTTTWNIRGGTPSMGNTNLFHSFGDLSVGTGHTAAFQNLQADGVTPVVTNASAVNNIIGRVTGGNPSNIFGTIDSRGGFPNASLFLINPAGIVFGPGASLNVGGAVHFSTADYLRLGTGNEFFYADLAKNSTLSSAPVTAFGFLGSNPIGAQAIEVQGTLAFSGAGSFSLVGRDIPTGTTIIPGVKVVGGQISNPGGNINIVSAGTPLDPTAGGEVSAIDFNPAPLQSGHGFASLGSILMTNNSLLSVTNASGPAAGQIVIRGGQLTMEQGSRLLARTTDVNTAPGGIDISLTGPMTLSGNQTAIDTENTGSANIPGGNILIRSGSLTVTDGAQIRTTNNSGQASAVGGNIDITADSITLSGAIDGGGTALSSGLFSGTARDTPGNGGNIHLGTTSLSVLDGGKIDASTQGFGKAGDININATQILLSGVNTTNNVTNVPSTISSAVAHDPNSEGASAFQLTGNGGNITIVTTSIAIHDGAQLQARTETAGNAGTIDITAGTLTLGGASTGFTSGISTASTLGGSGGGTGGQISLTTGSLSLLQGSSISTATSGAGNGGTIAITAGNVTLNGPNATIDGSTNGPFSGGVGGSIILTASNSLTIQGGAITTSSINGGGNAGTVQVSADQVLLSGSGAISSSTTGAGNGGTVSVTGSGPTGLVQLTGGTITAATTGSGTAGNIIVTGSTVTVSGATSSINSSTTGTGNAGNIQVQAGQVNLQNRGTISSASVAPARGTAGSVTISATDQFQSTGGEVTTSADNGHGGDITIQSNEILLNSGATVTASTTGSFDAGNIRLVAGDRIMLQDSTVTTSAAKASGGNITLQASNLVRLKNGQIISSVQGGPGTSGGDITIDPQAVLLENNSQILAQAFQGNGGNISITAGVLIVDGTSLIDASSQLGINGQVSLNAPLRNVAGAIMPLPQSFMSQANIYGQRCAAQKGGQFSSFVQGTRDGLPAQPGDFIPSPLLPNPSTLSSRQTGASDAPNLAAARRGLEPDGRLSFQPFVLFAGCRS